MKTDAAARKKNRRIYVLPSLLTMGNFCCGFFSIVLCLNAIFLSGRLNTMDRADFGGAAVESRPTPAGAGGSELEGTGFRRTRARAGYLIYWACVILFFSMVFDMLDGRVARLIGGESPFGTQIDSLADITSFGIAPGIVTTTLWIEAMPMESSWLGQVAIFGAVYAVCAALRLARYNVEAGTGDKNVFKGLPSPAAAGCVTTAVLVLEGGYDFVENACLWLAGAAGGDVRPEEIKVRLLAIFVLLVGFLMVTSIPFAHVANRYLTGRKPFALLVMVIFLLALVWHEPRLTLFAAFNGYMAAGVLGALVRRGKAGRPDGAADGVGAGG